MKSNKFKITVTIFSMLLCFGVFAQRGQESRGERQGGGQQRGSKPDAAKILEMLDTNNDDKIDKDEAAKAKRGRISENFDAIDTNDDEFINLEELEASLNNRNPKKVSAEEILKELDDNGDGTLNELEVAAKDRKELSENFKAVDTNRDNELDLEELEIFYAKNKKPKRKKRN